MPVPFTRKAALCAPNRANPIGMVEADIPQGRVKGRGNYRQGHQILQLKEEKKEENLFDRCSLLDERRYFLRDNRFPLKYRDRNYPSRISTLKNP